MISPLPIDAGRSGIGGNGGGGGMLAEGIGGLIDTGGGGGGKGSVQAKLFSTGGGGGGGNVSRFELKLRPRVGVLADDTVGVLNNKSTTLFIFIYKLWLR